MNDMVETTGRRMLAATLDFVVALLCALVVFATTSAGVYAFGLIALGFPMSDLLSDLGPDAAAFLFFEFLLFSPFGLLGLIEGTAIGVLCWRARRGLLAVRSPGMRLARISARPARELAP
jgi:hypothetical protein